MASVNKIIILGCVGANPKGISFKDGGMITRFPISTTETWRGSDGEEKSNIQWHNICIEGKAAVVSLKHIKKGDFLYIEGMIKTRRISNHLNQIQYITEVYSHNFQNIGSGSYLDNKV